MYPRRRIQPLCPTSAECGRGWVFFALYVFFFPPLMGLVQRSFYGELPIAEANAIYYLLCMLLVLLVLWSFLRRNFSLLLDWLPENLFAFCIGLVCWALLDVLTGLLPLPVQDPIPMDLHMQFLLSPTTTIVVVVLLIPVVEEILFRGLLFGSIRSYSRPLAFLLSTGVYALYCVWQFAFSSQGVNLCYLLLALRYAPMGLAFSWCYDLGGSVWSAAALHVAVNGLRLWSAVHIVP